tara:strand:+ start:418 stop:564 length:147 start_codon:yes stop_codon:yes gene_type:complete
VKNTKAIHKKTYGGSGGEVTYTKPVFDEEGNWISDKIISKEGWEKRQI